MGNCTSNDPKVGVVNSTRPIDTRSKNNNNGFKPVQLKNNSNTPNSKPTNNKDATAKAPLAFVISFDENKTNGNVINRPPPGRLQLEPIKHTPKETKAMLDEKMRLADAKRERILADRAKSSRGKNKNQNNANSRQDGSLNGSDFQTNSRSSSGYRAGSGQVNDSFQKNNNNSNGKLYDEEEEERKQRILNRKRINRKQDYDDDSDIEHDPTYKNDYKSDNSSSDNKNHRGGGGRY